MNSNQNQTATAKIVECPECGCQGLASDFGQHLRTHGLRRIPTAWKNLPEVGA